MTIEKIIEDLGGFGRFQFLMIAVVYTNKIYLGWSMLQMAYGGYIPEWHCGTVVMGNYGNDSVPSDNTTSKECSVNNSWTNYQSLDCDDFRFHGPEVTVITEWNLLCDRKYIKSLLTSIQMAGVLVGALVCGQLADIIGRKKTTYGFVLMHVIMNIVTAFSVSWEMFAAGRFMIGIAIGALLVVAHSYPMECLPIKWRPLLSTLPMWIFGTCVFAGFSMLLKNWAHLHIACGVFTLPCLIGYFYVPESMRWLAVQGRLEEAEEVCQKIASINRTEMPMKAKSLLQKIYQDEVEARQNARKYSYIDVFKGWYMFRISMISCFNWFSLSLIYYGISFGVSSLAGNLYLNIFLLSIVEYPLLMSMFFFVNRYDMETLIRSLSKFGRKRTAFVFLLIGFLASSGCLVSHFLEGDRSIISGLSLITKMGIGTGWAVIQTWGVELYPTVTRNLGYGAANTAARVGGIVAPFLIDFDNQVVLSYTIMAVLNLLMILLTLVTPETMGKGLPDSMETKGQGDSKSRSQIETKVMTPVDDKKKDLDDQIVTKF